MGILRRAKSLCPVCLRPVEGAYTADLLGRVSLVKTCPEHGEFSVPAWAPAPNVPAFQDWKNSTRPAPNPCPSTSHAKGCPFDCGLCPEHAGGTCCALLEVTARCNMGCPVCYASAGNTAPDPDLAALGDMLDSLKQHGGLANVQLSGGEPTVRDDLPEIIGLIREKAFPFIQLNTNGLRLAREAGYAGLLKKAGIDVVYLQWDGLSENTFRTLRGGEYLADKQEAARLCIEAGLPVVLVVTLARGVNDGELGDMLRTAVRLGPYARGLHIQPMAAFGRNPWGAAEAPRLTLPNLMLALEKQSGGLVKARDFSPPNSEHALCSMIALYDRTDEGGLVFVPGGQNCCCDNSRPQAHQARDFVARHWGGMGSLAPDAASAMSRRFTISAMAFQDAASLDLDRVRRCHLHIVTRDGRLVPFCMYNMTATNGAAIYRGR